MRVFFGTAGDPSVGIPSFGDSFELGFDFWEGENLDDTDDRERIRDILKKAFGEIYEEATTILFEDEADRLLLWKSKRYKTQALEEQKIQDSIENLPDLF